MFIAIAVPTHRSVEPAFAMSLGNMIAHTALQDVQFRGEIVRPKLEVFMVDGGNLEGKRIALARQALDKGADYVLWCDDDHTFPPDALIRLLRHNLPIVGCNYPRRNENLPTAVGLDNKFLKTTEADAIAGKVEPVQSLGFGFLLMQSRVLKQLPRPWFQSKVGLPGEPGYSEDVYFCDHARRNGIPTLVDHALSWEIGHISHWVLRNKDIA